MPRGGRLDIGKGQRFGRLIIAREIAPTKYPRRFVCKCDCGTYHKVWLADLTSGRTKSCGCLQRETRACNGKQNATHNLSHAPAYNSWIGMKTRCLNPNDPSYPRWGGVGVTICKRWKHSFENFYADMGARPKGKSLDRYPDPAGNYELGNCRWATLSEQRHNRRPGSKGAVKRADQS